ncbi:MAG: hypothetical protein V3U85_05765 [Hyphomicrobium sp.]
MRMAGWTWACGALLAAGAVLAPANAQELSEKATQTFMEYAWQLTPAAFTKPDGTTIQIDKKKKGDVMVPLDVARKVIRAGRLSAHAQVCELAQDQSDNHNSLMRRHLQSKKWTPQQLVYINQLHLTTVMLLTGRIMLVEKQGDKEVVVEEEKRKAQTCSEEQKQKVKEMIAAYVKSGPSRTKKAASASAADAQPAATAPVKKE